MGPFSLTGQPNAMGGREVGGLANQLAAHMGFANPADIDRVRRFWDAPRMATRPGLKAVELFEAMLDGRVKALWVLGTNPAASMPRAARVREALAACPFVVVSDCWPTDTTRFADVVLPAAGWGEKDGTVTNSERRISRQRAFRAPPGEARPDWWMLAEVARRHGLGGARFRIAGRPTSSASTPRCPAFENDGRARRIFDISALAGAERRRIRRARRRCSGRCRVAGRATDGGRGGCSATARRSRPRTAAPASCRRRTARPPPSPTSTCRCC